MTDAQENAWLISRALENIQAALDLINLPLKEQGRPYTVVGAIEESLALLHAAKMLLKETRVK